MVSYGFRPGCVDANERCPGGCQSWVSTTWATRCASLLMTGTTSSPRGTARAPPDRRKAFFILFADNLRTLDGNAAFLYGVNLVIAPKDLGAFQQIYKEAFGYHERLYA